MKKNSSNTHLMQKNAKNSECFTSFLAKQNLTLHFMIDIISQWYHISVIEHKIFDLLYQFLFLFIVSLGIWWLVKSRALSRYQQRQSRKIHSPWKCNRVKFKYWSCFYCSRTLSASQCLQLKELAENNRFRAWSWLTYFFFSQNAGRIAYD
jgi:hypothetical protein